MTYDPGVIIRAQRFRAQVAGFKLVRGHYASGDTDLATRWYVVPLDVDPEREQEHRQDGGYRTVSEAADAAVAKRGEGDI